MRVILYELNEVPWKVIDAFVRKYPNSVLAEILENSLQYTTVTHDTGELHPWTTWPSLHRGVYNDDHDIRFINQAITTGYAPTWEILSNNKIPVGVFGSLQSWPVPKEGEYMFYVPDTFAQTPETHPKSVEAFQQFNLEQTRKDGGVAVQSAVPSSSQLKNLCLMMIHGLRFSTIMTLVRHVINEKLNRNFKSIRSIMQSPVAFDFFFKLLKKRRPHYATFFTNHAAGMMHRYWKYTFPEDFDYTLKGDDDVFKSLAIMKAMQITDNQLKNLKNYADQENAVLVVASSMGQAAIERGEFLGELHVTDVKKFCKALEYGGPIHNNMAMSPDYSFSFKKGKDLVAFHDAVMALEDTNGRPVFTFKKAGLTLNINLQTNAKLIKEGAFYRGPKKKRERLTFARLGITVQKRDQGTAYHIPEGSVLFYRKGLKPIKKRKGMPLATIAPTLLSLFGVKPPKYMKAPSKEILERLK